MQKTKSRSLVAQCQELKHTYPESKGSIEKNRLHWSCELQPTPLSQTYKIKITTKPRFAGNYTPEIYVLSPKPLKMAEGKTSLPHVFDHKKQQICLYDNRCGEWNCSMSIAETIVPWAAEWLYFYEIWVMTGEWYGEGTHPRHNVSKKN